MFTPYFTVLLALWAATTSLASPVERFRSIEDPLAEPDVIFNPELPQSPSYAALLRGRDSLLVKRAVNVKVTGVLTGWSGTNRPSRLDLRSFVQNANQLNLFLHALNRMQKSAQTNRVSYYQLSGIHGRPHIAFDGVNGGNTWTGYCTHASILFPTWHRPYLALFEQVLHDTAAQIANEFPSNVRAAYQSAAATLRLPYWDWASSASMPSILTQETITVVTPTGNQRYHNPLYSYKFQSRNDFPDDPWRTKYSQTMRFPSSQWSNAVQQMGAVNQQLANNGASLRDRTYNVLARYTSFNIMSNKEWNNNGNGGYDSFEAIHDAIHSIVGNGGHMTYVDYSAFDPIFWLHHCNIDRLIALWQAINPTKWVNPQVTHYGTFTNNPGSTESSTTPLTPFHRYTNGQMWDSNSARYVKNMGYTYPEITQQGAIADSTLRSQVISRVNALYGPNTAKKKREIEERGIDMSSIIKDGKYYDWVCNIRIPRYAIKGPFMIQIFMGDFTSKTRDWMTDKNLVGTYGVTAVFPSEGALEACKGCEENYITGQIPLTTALIERIKDLKFDINSLDPSKVAKFLRRQLHWRTQLPDDSEVQNSRIRGLKISVAYAQVTLPASDDEFPTYSEYINSDSVTRNRTGAA